MSSESGGKIKSNSSTSAYGTIEKAQVDLVLLGQSLARGKRITTSVNGKLKDANDRLIVLEKSLVPIYKQTGRLMMLQTNVNTCLSSLNSVLGHQDLAESEAHLIKRGPNVANLKPYFRSLERLVASTEALQRSEISRQQGVSSIQPMLDLIEVGTSQLVKAFESLVEKESAPIPAQELHGNTISIPGLSNEFFARAVPILELLHTMDPGKFSRIEKIYANVRARFMEASLIETNAEAVRDAETLNLLTNDEALHGMDVSELKDDLSYGHGVRRLLGSMIALGRNEQTMLSTVFKLSNSLSQRTMYGEIISKVAMDLNATLGAVVGLCNAGTPWMFLPLYFSTFVDIKEELGEYMEYFVAKAHYRQVKEDFEANLAAIQQYATKGIVDLSDAIAKFGTSNQVLHAGVSSIVITAIASLRRLCENEENANLLIERLGASIIGMADVPVPSSNNAMQSPSKAWRGGNGFDVPSLARYITHIINSLLSSIEARGVNMGLRPEATVMFVLNNISYLRRNVLANHFFEYLGDAIIDELGRRVRSATTNYLDTLWAPLVTILESPDIGNPSKKSSKKSQQVSARDRLNMFYERWQDIQQLHKIARIDERELELRDRVRQDVERMLIPTYTQFMATNRMGDVKSTFPRMDPDQFAADLHALFV